MTTYEVHPIGKISSNEKGTFIELHPQYIKALKALDGFGHINVIWWFSEFDDKASRSVLDAEQPYKNAPLEMGIFATRSPIRPNPIALTTAKVIHIDYEAGIIQVEYLDANDETPVLDIKDRGFIIGIQVENLEANDETPVLDIKPYTPSFDRVETPAVPDWCSHWPKSTEESGDFPWENEFNF